MKALNVVRDIFIEFFLCISLPFWGIINNFFEDKEGKTKDGRVVVIVESWLNTNYIHRFFVRFLRKKGYVVYIKNFPLQRGDFEDKADELNEFLKDKKLSNFSLIGISGGAITALYYLNKFNKWGDIKKFISLIVTIRRASIGTRHIFQLTSSVVATSGGER